MNRALYTVPMDSLQQDFFSFPPQREAPVFVLVPGAWCGAWCWVLVALRLAAAGFRVCSLSLTGLAERQHLLSPAVSLETHVLDVVNLVRYRDLRDVVLVGHSYAGMVLTGAAEHLADRLRRLVYLDAMLPFSGECAFDLIPSEDMERRRQQATEHDGGVSMPVPQAEHFAVTGMRDWFLKHMTPQPLRPYDDRLHLAGLPGNGVPVTYVQCLPARLPAMRISAARARSLPGWRLVRMDSGHNVHLHRPDAVADLLVACAENQDPS